MIEVTVLGSGSGGNATLVRSAGASILIDAGFSRRQLVQRLAEVGWAPEKLNAIVISHEHVDHICGLRVFCKHFATPVYSTEETLQSDCFRELGLKKIETIRAGERFSIGDLTIDPFSIPHDAADPLGFVVRSNGLALGYVTDLGYVPELTLHHLRGCNLLVMETNHDPDMLVYGPYPWPVKQRILSRTGHLSNEVAARLLAEIVSPELQAVTLAHLSQQNNTAELALAACEEALGEVPNGRPEIIVADQFSPSRTMRVG